MKKLLLFILFVFCASNIKAQYCNFLGIPFGIDKYSFDKQIRLKGFKPDSHFFDMVDSYNYYGKLYGEDVRVMVDFNIEKEFVYAVNVMFCGIYEVGSTEIIKKFKSVVQKIKEQYKEWTIDNENESECSMDYWIDDKFPKGTIIINCHEGVINMEMVDAISWYKNEKLSKKNN